MPGTFEIKDGVLRKYRGKEARVSIPEGVTVIGESAFQFCHALTSVSIPEGVAEIGVGAFYGCEGLTVICPHDSYAWGYCEGQGIPVKPKST